MQSSFKNYFKIKKKKEKKIKHGSTAGQATSKNNSKTKQSTHLNKRAILKSMAASFM